MKEGEKEGEEGGSITQEPLEGREMSALAVSNSCQEDKVPV